MSSISSLAKSFERADSVWGLSPSNLSQSVMQKPQLFPCQLGCEELDLSNTQGDSWP